MRSWMWLPGVIAYALTAASASAAEPIGAAVVVVNQVTAKLDQMRTLQQGDGVHQNEMIEVATDASSELKLNDETKMALGPGAKLVLDKFVYDANEPKGSVVVNLAKGAFRFVTGVAAKPSYVVRVPQASITVRGTIFDVFVQDNGVSWLLLHEGAVTICNDRGRCRDLDEPGKLIRVTDVGDVGAPTRWAKLPQKTANFDNAFPFVEKKPQESPPVLTRDDIVIDVALPPKKRKVRQPDPPKYEPDPPKRKVREAKDTKDTLKSKPKRKVARNKGGGVDEAQIMDGVGIAIGIAGGIRMGGGRGGGRHHGGRGDYGGKPSGRGLR